MVASAAAIAQGELRLRIFVARKGLRAQIEQIAAFPASGDDDFAALGTFGISLRKEVIARKVALLAAGGRIGERAQLSALEHLLGTAPDPVRVQLTRRTVCNHDAHGCTPPGSLYCMRGSKPDIRKSYPKAHAAVNRGQDIRRILRDREIRAGFPSFGAICLHQGGK